MNVWYLKRVDLLEGIGSKELARVARVLDLKEIPKGAHVLLAEHDPQRVYFLLKGSVGVSRIDPVTGKEIMLYVIKPGEPFGIMGGLTTHSTSTATALKKSLVGYIDNEDFWRLAKDANLHPRIERLLESRLVKVENRLEELAFCDVPTRLARLLLRLAEQFPGSCPERAGTSIDLRLTQQEMGNLIAASREITSVTINDFLRGGWIKRHGRRICIHDRAALSRMAA